MVPETGAADPHRVLVLAGAAVLLGELGEYRRRRVTLNPASKLFEA